MTVKPILFSAPMVRALLEGRKTQTRRTLKVEVPPSPGDDAWLRKTIGGAVVDAPRHPAAFLDSYCSEPKTPANPRGMSRNWCWWTRDDRQCLPTFKVGYAPGDLLWVRESWRTPSNWDERAPSELRNSCLSAGYDVPWSPIAWEADGRRDNWGDWRAHEPGKLRPGIYLPREFSRLTLEVTGVKVERLQDISAQDAKAEGVGNIVPPFGDWALISPLAELVWDPPDNPPDQMRYAYLWNTINDKPGIRWADNPWIVAVTFTVLRVNVDAYLAQRPEAA